LKKNKSNNSKSAYLLLPHFEPILHFKLCSFCWWGPGALPRGDIFPTPHKGHFCKSSKTVEIILGVWG